MFGAARVVDFKDGAGRAARLAVGVAAAVDGLGRRVRCGKAEADGEREYCNCGETGFHDSSWGVKAGARYCGDGCGGFILRWRVAAARRV